MSELFQMIVYCVLFFLFGWICAKNYYVDKYGWHDCHDNGSPDDFYFDNNLDWVVVQFEDDTGFRPVPMVAEWSTNNGKWRFDSDEKNNIDYTYYQNLKPIAYRVIPRYEHLKQ